jgi:2-keto-4-pentenoate hydratase
MAGRILAETVIADGGTASMAGNEMRVAEPEFAFRMQADLPPRSSAYSVREVVDAVATLHPAIEIPDSRFSDFVSAGAAQIIADNACAHLFVLGAPTRSDWRALDLVEEKPVITLREKQFTGHGKNVLGDPLIALTWLANELRGLGITLRAGEVVTTGTCHPPLPIQSGDVFAADFGAIGRVSVRTPGLRSLRTVATGFSNNEIRWLWVPAFAGTTNLPRAKNRRAHAHMGRAERDRDRKIGAHAHRQILQPVARGNLRGQREMRRRGVVERRDAHQAGNFQTVFVAAAGNEAVGLARRDARLLRLLAGIELDEQLRPPFLGNDFLG